MGSKLTDRQTLLSIKEILQRLRQSIQFSGCYIPLEASMFWIRQIDRAFAETEALIKLVDQNPFAEGVKDSIRTHMRLVNYLARCADREYTLVQKPRLPRA